MNRDDLLWLAGFWDGEGTIAVNRTRTNKPYKLDGYLSYRPRCTLVNTNLEVMQYAEGLLSSFGPVCYTKREEDTARRKDRHGFGLNAWASCRDFALVIEPFLRIKSPQARLLIKWANHRLGLLARSHVATFTSEEHVWFEEMRVLNKRGR